MVPRVLRIFQPVAGDGGENGAALTRALGHEAERHNASGNKAGQPSLKPNYCRGFPRSHSSSGGLGRSLAADRGNGVGQWATVLAWRYYNTVEIFEQRPIPVRIA